MVLIHHALRKIGRHCLLVRKSPGFPHGSRFDDNGKMIGRLMIALALAGCCAYASPMRHALHREATSKGPLPVLRGGKWGYIDRSGKLVIAPQFEAADFFYEGLAAVRVNQGGFVDTAGKMTIPPKFSSIGRFSDGVAAVFIDGKTPQERVYGYIDKRGELIMKCPFACGRAYSEGMMNPCSAGAGPHAASYAYWSSPRMAGRAGIRRACN
jgi:hypothetical protein